MPNTPVSPLAGVTAFASLTGGEVASLMAQSRAVRVPAGRQIITKGEVADTIMVLLEGRLRVSAVSLEGRTFTFRLVEPVEVVGEIGVLDGKPRTADVTSVTAARLLLLRREACLDAVARHPAVAKAMINLLCSRLRDTSAGLESVAMQRLPVRMAELVLNLATEYGQPTPRGGIQLPMRISQTEIGTLVAATREAVNKQLRTWREEAVLDIAAGRIEVINPAALAALLA